MIPTHTAAEQLHRIWSLLESDPIDLNNLTFVGPKAQILPSIFDISGFAAASIASANLAASQLFKIRLRQKTSSHVEVNVFESAAAFFSESLLKPIDWKLPDLWDPIAGNYQTSDRWIRLHTNYKHHREAVLRVLKLKEATRSEVEKHVANWRAEDLESKVVEEGGCAAVMYTRDEWLSMRAGASTRHEKALFFEKNISAQANFGNILHYDKPLSGIRVLDLTRVIAGPECTRFLAGHGADVLRIDPTGFEEVPALVPDMTVGKKCAFLNLNTKEDQKKFEVLLREAHVLILGLRMDALEHCGFSLTHIQKLNPALIIGKLNAYGWESEWKLRRGFDSLVQMSCGIAALGAQKKQSDKPYPLPVQALDHGAGYLLAAGICRALSMLHQHNLVLTVKTSLIGIANFLFSGPEGNIEQKSLQTIEWDSCLFTDQTEWGTVKRVLPPGLIDTRRASWHIPAGPLGKDSASFNS